MKRKLLIATAALPALVGLVLLFLPLKTGVAGHFLETYAAVCVALLLGWAVARFSGRLFWRVGRRLALSYFLIGVLPIPMAILMLLVLAYIANGFFLGHLYRDTVHSVSSELRAAAREKLVQLKQGRVYGGRVPIPVAFAYYRDGLRFAGDGRAPRVWQPWWVQMTVDTAAPSPVASPFLAAEDGRPTLIAAREDGRFAVLAFYDGDLELELSERSGIWVELLKSNEESEREVTSVTFKHRNFVVKLPRLDWEREDLREFFHSGVEHPSLLDRPSLVWAEISRPFLNLSTGEREGDYVAATLTASPRTTYFHLISRSAEVDAFAYFVLFLLAFALFDLWVVAVIVALLVIFGLSRAVDRLSRATQDIREGDFSTRIEVRRNDQIGELHHSFNQMAANLEELVAKATQKEILERELEIARELQQSLLPGAVFSDESLEFATHFAPSAAIGGDYYDFLPLDEDRLAVVVADVSGHGLSAGLRMAMVKSALQLLCEQGGTPKDILKRVDDLQRSSGSRERSGFVTATLAIVDRRQGELLITNAGHPPTYLLRGGRVEEILLPSMPLGTLVGELGQRRVPLQSDDVVVWLSDGLIEATDARDEPFGYEGVLRALEGQDSDPGAVRDRLLAALDAHTGGRAPDDDRSLVVMAYRPPVPASEAAGGGVEAPASVESPSSA